MLACWPCLSPWAVVSSVPWVAGALLCTFVYGSSVTDTSTGKAGGENGTS
jgi:hypothetical protein